MLVEDVELDEEVDVEEVDDEVDVGSVFWCCSKMAALQRYILAR
jgi:hypothetical protein